MTTPQKKTKEHDGRVALDWEQELHRLVRLVGDDADELERAASAVLLDATDDDSPAVAAIARHCEAGPATNAAALAASALQYAHTRAEQREVLEAFEASQRDIDEVVRAVQVIEISDDDDDGDAAVAVADSDSDVEVLDPPAADDDAALARRLAAEERKADRARRRQSEADAKIARDLERADDDARRRQSDADEKFARELTNSDGGAASAVAGGDDFRALRVVVPGGASVRLRRVPAGRPLALVFELVRDRLGLGPRDDPLATFEVLGPDRRPFSRAEVRETTIGEVWADRSTVRVERRASVGAVVRGAGAFVGRCKIMRLKVGGVFSPIVVVRDFARDNGLRVARLVEEHCVGKAAQPGRNRAAMGQLRATKALRDYVKAARKSEPATEKPGPRAAPGMLTTMANGTRNGTRGGMQTIPLGSHRRGIAGGGVLGGFGGVPEALREIADEVLDLAAEAVRDASLLPVDGRAADDATRDLAAAALSNRRGYYLSHGIMYPSSGTLPNHIDGMGHWVVLFSLGNTAKFHCGTPSGGGHAHGGHATPLLHPYASSGDANFDFDFRSGDALVFNGAPAHLALHGMSHVKPNSQPKGLPDWLRNTRVSVQIRQA